MMKNGSDLMMSPMSADGFSYFLAFDPFKSKFREPNLDISNSRS